MKRNITLYSGTTQQSSEEHISIENIDNVVQFSVDNMFCDCLESIDEKIAGIVLQKMLDKIRPEGYLYLHILDIKTLCVDVLQNHIAFSEFLSMLQNKYNIVTLDVVSSNIDFNKFQITKLVNDKYRIEIIIKRTMV
jgi:hypothetical protein